MAQYAFYVYYYLHPDTNRSSVHTFFLLYSNPGYPRQFYFHPLFFFTVNATYPGTFFEGGRGSPWALSFLLIASSTILAT